MTIKTELKDEVVIRFAGDSGDGIQLTGSQFTSSTALSGHDLGTLPDFPAEIRAPAGTVSGVSGFQIQFAGHDVFTPGDLCDVLVVMNAAALKSNIRYLKNGGVIIANEDGFDAKNLRLAGFDKGDNPLKDKALEAFEVYEVPVTRLVRETLKDTGLGTKERDRSKNMFVLGLLFWLYSREITPTEEFLKRKFSKDDLIADANIRALKAGYNFGDTAEIFTTRFRVKKAQLTPGEYRGITGNVATALGLIAAAQKAGLRLFYGSYPITPASDILHELSRHRNFDLITFQAEDEIAAISSVIGASFGGSLGVTGTSGPGLSLKGEALGLAVSLELPLVVCNVQRSGPSTGMPTKTEQADLLQAMYGRHGEAPLPIVAPATPSDCFEMAFMACKIAVECMTPVIFLSDGYLGNGAEPWRFPNSASLSKINPPFPKKDEKDYQPYKRDENLVRKWAVPGMKGFENRIGGLEKEDLTGNVSYDPANHEKMTQIRQEKIDKITRLIPPAEIITGNEEGEVLLLGWGSTFGAIKTAANELIKEGYPVSHVHLRYLNPLPSNLGEVLKKFKKIIIPELNNGQLIKIIRDRYLVPAIPYNKIQGLPFSVHEIKDKVIEITTPAKKIKV